MTDESTVQLPPGEPDKVPALIDLIKAHMASNGISRKPQWPETVRGELGACVICDHPVVHVSGPMSKVTVGVNIKRITTRAALTVWNRTGVCEQCSATIQGIAA